MYRPSRIDKLVGQVFETEKGQSFSHKRSRLLQTEPTPSRPRPCCQQCRKLVMQTTMCLAVLTQYRRAAERKMDSGNCCISQYIACLHSLARQRSMMFRRRLKFDDERVCSEHICKTRKPCCRKETARCRKCSFPLKFANNIHYKYKKD